MKTAVVVPLNAFAAAKSRLRDALAPCEREALVRWMAGRVLDAVRDAGLADCAAVVSPDDEVLAWATRRGATPLRQSWGGLNDGLELGRRWALARGAQSLLVLLGDLPRLAPADLDSLTALGRAAAVAPLAVLAPDRHGRGTNAMLQRPPAALPFAFGADSFARHLALARERSVTVRVYRSSGTSRDVDTVDDVRALVASGLWRPDGHADVPAVAGRGGEEP